MDESTYIMQFGKFKRKPIDEVPFTALKVYYCDNAIMQKYPELKTAIEHKHPDMYIVKNVIKAKHHGAFPHLRPEPICESGKQCYSDQEEAKKALKLIKQDKRDHKKPIRTYFHDSCGFWHLTSEELVSE